MAALFLNACGPSDVCTDSVCYCEPISIVLTNEVSLEAVRQGKTYTPADFPEVQLSSVIHVSLYAEDNVRRQLNGEEVEWPVSMNSFRISLDVRLVDSNHQKVQTAVALLKARSDIYGVSPNGPGPSPA